MENTEQTIFKIQLKPKQLRSALFWGTDCPLPAVSRIGFIQRCNVHSVPVILPINTRYQENLTEVTNALCVSFISAHHDQQIFSANVRCMYT